MLVCCLLLLGFLPATGNSQVQATRTADNAQTQSVALTSASSGQRSNDRNAQAPAMGPLAGETSAPVVAPVPATTGTPGIFTVESGETLSKRTFTVSAYADKFGEAPGSVTMLGAGFSLAAGLTNKVMLFAQFEPYQHLHIGLPSQLSLRQPATCPHDVFEAPVYCGVNPGPLNNTWKGPAAAYVPYSPFAAYNTTDYGPVTVGLKTNFWSETRGDPLSVSMRFSLMIPTESSATELANFGTQPGTLNYSFTLGLNRTLHDILFANNVTYLVTRNPRIGRQTLLTPGDRIIFGQGFIFRASHRLQVLAEFTGVLPQEGHGFGLIGIDTENTSQGPNDPVDGVWGVRWYFLKSAAIDVGYRYMLNLHQVHDRSGFNIKISKAFALRNR